MPAGLVQAIWIVRGEGRPVYRDEGETEEETDSDDERLNPKQPSEWGWTAVWNPHTGRLLDLWKWTGPNEIDWKFEDALDIQGDVDGSKPRWSCCGNLCFQPATLECKRLVSYSPRQSGSLPGAGSRLASCNPQQDCHPLHAIEPMTDEDINAEVDYPVPPVSGPFLASNPAREFVILDKFMTVPGTPPQPASAESSPQAARPAAPKPVSIAPCVRSGPIVCTPDTFLQTVHLAPRALKPTRPGEPERALYFPSYRAEPSPCGGILVDIRPYGPCSEIQRSRLMQRFQRGDPAAPIYKLVHYDIQQDRLHEVMTHLPIQTEFSHVFFQPTPLASRIYAWPSFQGPVFIIDAAQHRVLTRIQLTLDPAALCIEGAFPNERLPPTDAETRQGAEPGKPLREKINAAGSGQPKQKQASQILGIENVPDDTNVPQASPSSFQGSPAQELNDLRSVAGGAFRIDGKKQKTGAFEESTESCRPGPAKASTGAVQTARPAYRDDRLWELDEAVPLRRWNLNHMEYDRGLMHGVKWSHDGCQVTICKDDAYAIASFVSKA